MSLIECLPRDIVLPRCEDGRAVVAAQHDSCLNLQVMSTILLGTDPCATVADLVRVILSTAQGLEGAGPVPRKVLEGESEMWA